MKSWLVLVCLANLLLAACSSMKIEPITFACPISGTVTMVTSEASKTGAQWQIGEGIKPASQTRETWLGSDPSDPEVCLRKLDNRPEQRLLYGIYLLPTDGEDGYRRGFRQAFSGDTHAVCFEKLDRPINTAPDTQPVSYNNCITGRGMMNLETRDGSNRVFVISISSNGNGFVGNYIFFYDPARHIIIGRNNSGTKGNAGQGMRRTIG